MRRGPRARRWRPRGRRWRRWWRQCRHRRRSHSAGAAADSNLTVPVDVHARAVAFCDVRSARFRAQRRCHGVRRDLKRRGGEHIRRIRCWLRRRSCVDGRRWCGGGLEAPRLRREVLEHLPKHRQRQWLIGVIFQRLAEPRRSMVKQPLGAPIAAQQSEERAARWSAVVLALQQGLDSEDCNDRLDPQHALANSRIVVEARPRRSARASEILRTRRVEPLRRSGRSVGPEMSAVSWRQPGWSLQCVCAGTAAEVRHRLRSRNHGLVFRTHSVENPLNTGALNHAAVAESMKALRKEAE